MTMTMDGDYGVGDGHGDRSDGGDGVYISIAVKDYFSVWPRSVAITFK